nr:acyltransferase [Halobacillus locisalis]
MIQIARAIAIIFVLIGHANVVFLDEWGYDWLQMGSWERTGGVDFFFIITGFMIYYMYHGQAGEKGKVSKFLMKRTIRIFPLYWLFTTVALLAALFLPFAAQEMTDGQIWRSFFLLPGEPILASAWSLTYIFAFYLLFSAYLYLPKVFLPLIFIWSILTLLAAIPGVVFLQPFWFSISIVEILSGSVVAYVTLRFTIPKPDWLLVIGLAGFIGVWVNNNYGFIDLSPVLFYWIFAILVVTAIAEKDKKDRKVPAPLSFLGDASYSIYIAHGPFLQLYIYIWSRLGMEALFGSFLSLLFLIVLSVLSSCLVYIVIEKPMNTYLRGKFLHRKQRKTQSPLPVPMTESQSPL